jgi:hypothetical protein
MKNVYLVGTSCVMNALLVLGWSGEGGVHRLALVIGGVLAGVVFYELVKDVEDEGGTK